MVLKVQGGGLPGFRVRGGKTYFRKSWVGNVDFFLIIFLHQLLHQIGPNSIVLLGQIADQAAAMLVKSKIVDIIAYHMLFKIKKS